MKLPVVDETVAGKRVLIRGDIDVPLSGGKVTDDTRLLGIKPTIDFLSEHNCQVILAGHVGRPEGKVVPELSTKPIQDWFGEKIKVLENLRFDPREEANDEGLAKELAAMANIYVNEAFGTSYENHASIVGVPKLLPHFAGLRLAREVEVLSQVLENPKRPLLVIIGGSKTKEKIPAISGLQKVADRILLGGRIVVDIFSMAREKGITLNPEKVTALPLTADFKDIFAQAIANSVDDFMKAGTIVWNGPFGAVEEEEYQLGTRMVADLILGNPRAYKVVGGGDTVAFLDKLKVTDKFDWVSSGGGSMLKFLAGEKLPGIEALLL